MRTLKARMTALTVMLGLAAGSLLAQPPRSHEHRGEHRKHAGTDKNRPEQRLKFLSNYLNLTDQQKDLARSLIQQGRTEAAPIVEQMKNTRKELKAAVQANSSQAEIERLAAAQGTLVGQIAAIKAKHMATFYAQLTPEQREKADQLRGMFMGKGHSRPAARF